MANHLPSLYPFTDYTVYGPIYHKQEKRMMVVIVHKQNEKVRSSLSYARYLYQTHHAIKLDQNQHIDHIDNDRLNDTISNLQVLSDKENKDKYSSTLIKHTIILTCDRCGEQFERLESQSCKMRGGLHNFCSKQCRGNGKLKRK